MVYNVHIVHILEFHNYNMEESIISVISGTRERKVPMLYVREPPKHHIWLRFGVTSAAL